MSTQASYAPAVFFRATRVLAGELQLHTKRLDGSALLAVNMSSAPTLVRCALETVSSGGKYPIALGGGAATLVNCLLDIGGSWPSGRSVNTFLTDDDV